MVVPDHILKDPDVKCLFLHIGKMKYFTCVLHLDLVKHMHVVGGREPEMFAQSVWRIRHGNP